mgnify:FL=1
MVFSSLTFLYLFLPAVLIFLLIFRKLQYQNWILFLFSLLFYAWGGVSFTLLLLGSIFVNYIAGLLIDRYRKYGKSILFGAIILNLSTLFYFKYANFFVDNLNLLITRLGASSITIQKVILPIGISFFTFQGISYIVDVFRGNVAAQRNPVIIGSYIALFPQLIAGPIIRYNEIESQFTRRDFTIENFYNGIKRFTLGLARKVFLANQLALIADSIFALETSEMTPLIAWAGILCYALQIYHDFAGYSDMAIGLGKMFGFTFPENFNFPYIAQSIQEFWRRWHITLSAWFKDYLYIPLGGNRCSQRRVLINLYIVFFCTGLWHGASWNFVIWGLLHGTFLVIERIGFKKILEKIWSPIRHLYTLLIVLVAWVFFRTETLPDALTFIKTMFFMGGDGENSLYLTKFQDWINISAFIIAILTTTPIFSKISERFTIWSEQRKLTLALNHLIIYALVIATFIGVTILLCVGSYNPFIYYRF